MRELLEELAREPRQPGTPGRLRRYSAGEVIAHEGDLADTLHLVRKGRVAVSITTRYGNQVTFTVLGPGDVFGELALLSPESRRSAGLIALDATETVTLGKAEFDRLRTEHPEFGEALTALLAERVRRLSDQLVEALYVPADTRVLRRLLTLARLYEADEVPLAQDDLAGHRQHAAGHAVRLHVIAEDHPPLQPAGHDVSPSAAECALLARFLFHPAIDFGHQIPLVQALELRHPLQWIAAEQDVDGGREDLAQLKIDAAHGAVEIDLVIQIQARVQEHEQRLRAVAVQRQSEIGDEGVVDDPLHINGTGRDAADVGVTRHVVHVVCGEGAYQQRAHGGQPGRRFEVRQLLGGDQVGDPARIDTFAGFELLVG